MKTNSIICMLIFLAAIFVILLTNINNNYCVENFGNLLGNLGPYKEELNECLKNAEKVDPTNRLGPGSNIYGNEYCNNILTEKSKLKILPKKHPSSIINICRDECDVPGITYSKKRKCISKCSGLREVIERCAIEFCPYSKLDPKICMSECTSRLNVNNNQISWNWKPT